MQTTRRDLLRTSALLGGAAMLGTSATLVAEETAGTCSYCPNTVYSNLLGWTIGPQIYSFNRFTFEQGIKNCQKTGSRNFEVFIGQRLTDKGDVKVSPDMSAADKKLMRTIMADHGLIPHAVGVTGSDRKMFDFAAEMAIPVINSEPGFNRLAEVNKLAEEYKINVGLHNHPKPSIYWDFNIVLEHLKDCGSRVGACCDTGHYVRSGLVPLEAIKALKGKIISFHIKDLHKLAGQGEGPHDVPLGKGVCGIADVMKELASQGFRGPFSIEYEYNWDANTPDVAECVKFFNETSKSIVLG